MAHAIAAFGMANDGDEMILDISGVVKATPLLRQGTFRDQDYHDAGYHNITVKQRCVRRPIS